MLLTGKLVGLYFKHTNIINFWIVGFAIIETKEILTEKHDRLAKDRRG